MRVRRWIPVLVVVFVACQRPVGAGKKASNEPKRRTPEAIQTSAKVDGAEVTLVPRLRVNNESVDAAELWRGEWDELATKRTTLSAEGYQRWLDQRAVSLIQDKVAEMLLYQRAVLRNPVKEKDPIDRFVDEQIRKTVTADHDGVQRRYEKQLESKGQTLEDVRTQLRRHLVITRYFETELRPRIPEATRAELMARFEENQDEWRKPERRRMALIEVRVRDRASGESATLTPEKMDEVKRAARERIDLAWRELQGGAAFGEVAKRYSDGSAAADGGGWGWVGRDSVRPRYQAAVDALYQMKSEQVSEIISTDEGFFIVRCDEVEAGMEPDFQRVQPQLMEKHFRQNYNRMLAEIVRELREKARIEPENLELFHAAVVSAAAKVPTEGLDAKSPSVNLAAD